jgi:DNA-binding winged helix-turn-helix (wHTH) protein
MPKQQQIEHILTPETERRFFTDQILSLLTQGECLTLIWTPHGGATRQMNFLTQYSSHLEFSKLGKYLIIYLDQYDLLDNSSEGYFQLMNYCLDNKETNPLTGENSLINLKLKISSYLQDNYHLIFILNEFDKIDFTPQFFNCLKNIWHMEKSKIHFIFGITQNIFTQENLKRYDQLGELITQNLIFCPLLSSADAFFVMNRLKNKYGFNVPQEKYKEVAKISGGHPLLIKTCLSMFSKNPNLDEKEIQKHLLEQWEIKLILEDIWDAFTSNDKQIVNQIALGEAPPRHKASDFLLKLKLVTIKDNQYGLFTTLFEEFVKNKKIERQTLSLNKNSGEILINGFPFKEKITLKEYRLLSLFLENQNKLINRDQIAEALWGTEGYDKYSNWAIDQNISLLRKKLQKLGFPSQCLQTIKGLGYRWLA